MCGETGSAITQSAVREEGPSLFIKLPVTSAHQGARGSRSPAAAGEKVRLLVSQMFYSATTVCAPQFVYAVCSCFQIRLRTSLKTFRGLFASHFRIRPQISSQD